MRVLYAVLCVLLASSPPAFAKLKVVATLEDFASIASAIGGDRIETLALAKGYQDPHYVDAKPSFVLQLSRAGLLIVAGLDLEAVADKSDLRSLVPEGAPPPVPAPKSDVDVWLAAAKELFALGDFTGSLELIEKILQLDPDHGEARDYLRQNEATLVSMYESKLAPLTRIPRLAIKPEEVMWLNLDHRAGFLLAQIDGTVDYESLFALSGLPRLDTARILANLIADGVIRS